MTTYQITITPENISTVSNSELKENYDAANYFLKSATEMEEIQELCHMKSAIEKECHKRRYDLK